MSQLPPPPPAGSLPLPPPPAGATPAGVPGLPPTPPPPRAGELSPGWRTVYFVTWVCVVLVLASVWRSARTMGFSTWWLGASSDPQPVVVQLVPFVGPLLATVAAGRNLRFLPLLGIVVGLAGIGIALVDAGTFDRLVVLQVVAAAAGLLVSVASLAGRYVRDDTPTGAPVP